VKKTVVGFTLIVLAVAFLLPLTFNMQAASAQTSNYTIQNVVHNVQILSSGQIVITDNIQLSGQKPSSFQIGFPYKYGQYLLEGVAYDPSGKELPITLGVSLQDQSGFYGATIDLTTTSYQNFSVALIFANGLLTPNISGFQFDFPAYPSFLTVATKCTTNIVLPIYSQLIGIAKPDGVVNATSFSITNLAKFTYAPAIGTCTETGRAVQLVDINYLNSQVTFSPTGDVARSDSYRITNKQSASISFFPLNIPTTATNVVVRDQFGSQLTVSTINLVVGTTIVNATFVTILSQNQSTLLAIDYTLPKQTSDQVSDVLFPIADYYVQTASVSYSLPEGAHFTSPTSSSTGYTLNRAVFGETLTVKKQGVSFVDSSIPAESLIQFNYDYNYLWVAFRPTIWMSVIAIIGIGIVAFTMRPKGKSIATPRAVIARLPVGAALSGQQVQQFIETYEEKNKVTQEIRTLEARAQHGRIPRRRYKVQRRTLELRLESLSHNAANLKEEIRSAGGSYSDMVKQLDSAEVELNEVDMSIRNIEVKHETGELSLEAFRKQLSDLERRKEKAETTVNGLLLRLRGEIR
jgi:hypothetical protein